MKTLLYFAYGSNLHPNWLRSRTPSAKLLGRESLPGYSLHFNKAGVDQSGKCNIVSSEKESIIHGVVYEFPAAEKPVLDEAERGYQQAYFQLGEYENVLVYHCERSSIDGKAPYSWYQDIVIAGAALHGFPEDYLAHIRSFSARQDPDGEREHRHRSIVWP